MSDSMNSKPPVPVTLELRPERRTIRAAGSRRYLDFVVTSHRVVRPVEPKTEPDAEKKPLDLALVIDRSGSMHGDKIRVAREAAMAVVERMRDDDRVAVVTFDNKIDVLQPATKMTGPARTELLGLLATVEARGGTALHEGWLKGCLELAATDASGGGVRRSFLLTDGQANQGITDPEVIASQAAEILERSGVSTSTFGIGTDYNEFLLGPMAMAGGGGFHNLRVPSEIVDTFLGELGDLRQVWASNVRLEVVAGEDVELEDLGARWTGNRSKDPKWRLQIPFNYLRTDEQRHLTVKCRFPRGRVGNFWTVRARLLWESDGESHASEWQEIAFEYGTEERCNAEAHDMEVLRRVAQELVDQTVCATSQAYSMGGAEGACEVLEKVCRKLRHFPGGDPVIDGLLRSLEEHQRMIRQRSLDSASSKEAYYRSTSRSRGTRDYRRSHGPGQSPYSSDPNDPYRT